MSRAARPVLLAAKAHGLTTRSVLVAAAIRVTERLGFENLTIAAVAKEVGVRAPSLYKHVETLGELEAAVARECTRQLLAALQAAPRTKPGREARFALLEAFRRFAKRHPGLYAATVRTPHPDDEGHVAARQAMVELLADTLGGRGIPERRMLHVTRAVRAAMHGFVSLELAGGLGRPVDVDESFRRMGRRILWNKSSPRCPFASGCSVSRSPCAIWSRTTRSWPPRCSAAQLNWHLHTLVADLLAVAWSTCQRIIALLRQQGQWVDAEASELPETDRLLEENPLLAKCYAASIAGVLLFDNQRRPMRLFSGRQRASPRRRRAMASTWTRPYVCRRPSASGSLISASMCCARPSPTAACSLR